MFRQTLLPALAPFSDNNSNRFSQSAFSVLQQIDRQLCGALGCIDRPVSDFSAWKITSASLTLDNAQEGLKNPPKQSILQVDIQNRLTLPVSWPSLEVSLTDAEESVIQTITFTPDQWIPSQFQELHPNFLRTGASALENIHTELVITLASQVAGYRVRLFYPSH
jgi:ribosomal protein L11 methyltransferase